MVKKKRKADPKARAAAAKRMLSKRMSKKKIVLGNGTGNNDRAPIQPEQNDQNKEMMEP